MNSWDDVNPFFTGEVCECAHPFEWHEDGETTECRACECQEPVEYEPEIDDFDLSISGSLS